MPLSLSCVTRTEEARHRGWSAFEVFSEDGDKSERCPGDGGGPRTGAAGDGETRRCCHREAVASESRGAGSAREDSYVSE